MMLGHHISRLRPQFIMLFRLIIANHFETIPNDMDHPIVLRKTSHHPLRAYYDIFSRQCTDQVSHDLSVNEDIRWYYSSKS